MLRFLAASAFMLVAVGSASAELAYGPFVKYEKGQITVKEGDVEKTFDVPSTLRITVPGKKGSKDAPAGEILTKLQKSGNKPKIKVVYDEVPEKGKAKGKTKQVVRAILIDN